MVPEDEAEEGFEHAPPEHGVERDGLTCGTTRGLVNGVVGLLIAGQVLNVIWARTIAKMATKGKKAPAAAADMEAEGARSPSPKGGGHRPLATDGDEDGSKKTQ